MESKKITQLATEVAPLLDDLTFIGDPITGQLKKVTLNQIAYIFGAGSAWGTITGTLSNQTDLQAALNLKVPYTGATANVDLGAYNITATSLIKNGGVGTQFLKADGSIDNNTYLTADDLPSTLSLYATTAAASVSGYFKLVTTIDDPDFNTTAVDVSTGEITTTDQLISSLVSPANLINGNPGVFNVTTYGNIKKVSGSGQAEFYFKVYKRTAGGVETLVGTSSNTIPVVNTGYSEFFATAIWNDGIFGVTDTIVLKYYATRISGGSNPTYNFQFGGVSPVRTIVPIPTAVIPNIYLADLADVEDGIASNNDGIYYDSSVSLWKYKSVAEALGYTPANAATYVPYTGATANVDLGVYSLTSSAIISKSVSVVVNGTASSPLILKTGTSGLSFASDAISLISSPTSANTLSVYFDVATVKRQANFNANSLTATRTYTLPDASGTLALTSNLASYVPYTGATSGVNLGGNDLTGGSFIANGISSYSGSISLKQNGLILAYSGYTTLSSSSAGKLNIYFGDASAYAVTLQNNLLTDSRSYDFPNASGTLALTSNLASYVPYTGATGAVNLGTNELTSGNAKITDTLYLKVATTYAHASGYYGIQVGTNLFIINNSASTQAVFSLASLTTSRTFTLPDASGTVALTSNLTNMVTGTGTTNYLPKFTGASTIGNSIVQDNGSKITIGGNLQVEYPANGNIAYFRRSGGSYNFALAITGSEVTNTIGFDADWGTATKPDMIWSMGAAEKMRLTNTGNLGLGVTPSAWASGSPSLQVYSGGLYHDAVNYFTMFNNAYWNGTSWRYINTNYATLFTQNNGTHAWFTASSGTAGSAISFGQPMTLTAAGRLLLGTTTESTYLLDVNGTGRFSGAVKITTGTDGLDIGAQTGNSYRANAIFRGTTSGGSGVNGYTGVNVFSSDGSMDIAVSGSNALKFYPAGSLALTLASTGAATFSSSVRAGTGTFASSSYINGVFQRTAGNGSLIEFKNYATTTQYNWFVGCSYNNSNVFEVIRSTAADNDSPSGTSVLSIASTGAATFSSSVQTTDLRYSGTGYLTYDASNSGTGTFAIRTGGGYTPLTLANTGAATFSGLITGQNGIYQSNASASIASNKFETYNGGATPLILDAAGASASLDFRVTGSTKLLIASTGAATFSSSVTAVGSVTSSGSMGRFGGWYDALGFTGAAVEAGVSGGIGYVIGYNRSGSAAIPIVFGNAGNSSTMVGSSLSFTGAATFSSSVTATGLYINANANSDWAAGINNLGTTSANGLYVNIGASSTGKPFAVYKNFSQLFGVENSGAATFSSDVSMGRVLTLLHSYNPYILLNVNGTQQWQLAGEGGAFKIYNSTAGTNPLAISTTGAATFSSSASATMFYVGTSTPSDASLRVELTSGYAIKVTRTGLDRFWVDSDGAGYLKAAAWTYGSDLRLKENIKDVVNGIDTILKLKPKHFDYIDGIKNNLGFIAQDVKDVIPQAVSNISKDSDLLGLKTDFIVPYLVKAIQELKAEIEILKNK